MVAWTAPSTTPASRERPAFPPTNTPRKTGTASIWGLVGAQGASAYIASKHAVVGLTRAAALEYAQQGIRINALNPGAIRTPLLEPFIAAIPDWEATITAQHPVGRTGTPQEVAEALVWLCSDAASFVIGHNLTVDGGYMAQ